MDEKEMKARKRQRKANKKKFLTSIYSKRVNDLITKHNLTQYELGQVIGVSEMTISKWRRKVTAPQPALRDAIDEVYNNGFNPLNYAEAFNQKKKREVYRIKPIKIDIIYYASLVSLLVVSLLTIYLWR
jgi:transcriptional regulator with XRE-family HTH domain|tara:strand:- start:372 stop:758 length:387 start_codon:yes stop_codon:yes gene_type:complete